MMRAKELLALNIKILRKKWGFLKKNWLRLQVSAQTISDIEDCRTWVSDKTAETLENVLKVEIFQLFMPSEEETRDNPESLFTDEARTSGKLPGGRFAPFIYQKNHFPNKI